MKIAFNTENVSLLNTFIRTHKDNDIQVINSKVETVFFETIENGDVDAYVISSSCLFGKKAVDFIKKSNPYIPIVFLLADYLSTTDNIPNIVDIIIPKISNEETLSKMIYYNINMYKKNFETLHKLTAKMHDKIEFGNCTYDPTRRILYYNDKEIEKLSAKKGGILEILALNFGEVVKKEVILEKVWRKADYFNGRSMDVFVTHLRNTFKNNEIKFTIKNISGIGLILE